MINQKLSQIQKIKQNIIVSNNLFHEELVCLGFNARNKDEALSKGVEILQENGAVNEYFIEEYQSKRIDTSNLNRKRSKHSPRI